MTDFDATLTRAFAEAPEPADDGFSVSVVRAVRGREKLALGLFIAQGVGLSAAVAVVLWALGGVFAADGAGVMAALGLEVARAHGALTQASSINLLSMAAGLTQILFALGALAGSAVLYRASQQ